jgi:uncharacterized RDD family membrane protein YckC
MAIARYEKRIWAWTIDKLLSFGVFGLFIYLFLRWFGPNASLFLLILLAYLVSYAFYVVFNGLWSFFGNGATLGMLIFRIRAVHADGCHLSLKEAFLKVLLTGLLVMDAANSLYMLLTHTERSIFDRMSETTVIDVHPQ